MEYVDSCRTYQILLQDSGLAEKPTENWNTFKPKKGDVAHVDEDNKDYQFTGKKWVELINNAEQE